MDQQFIAASNLVPGQKFAVIGHGVAREKATAVCIDPQGWVGMLPTGWVWGVTADNRLIGLANSAIVAVERKRRKISDLPPGEKFTYQGRNCIRVWRGDPRDLQLPIGHVYAYVTGWTLYTVGPNELED